MPGEFDGSQLKQLFAIAGMYLSVYDVDVPANTFSEVRVSDQGVSSILGDADSDAQAEFHRVAEKVVDAQSLEAMLRFLDFATFGQRFADANSETIEFLDSRHGWCRGRLVVSERTSNGGPAHVLWLVEGIDDEVRGRMRLRRANEALEEANRDLVEKADAAERIAALAESVSSLLTNMPGLTFSKDAETGRYLACNQRFADFAHKPNPAEVAGLTDFDIFDPETAAHFVKDDKTALSMDEPYVFYEDVADAAGLPRQFQTTKLQFVDERGRHCLLGMCVDVTEMMQVRRETAEAREAYERARTESLTYSRIARALSADYAFLYYVDVRTDTYAEYSSDEDYLVNEKLTIARVGDDFFETSRRNAQEVVYPKDREAFLGAFSKEAILRSIDENGSFTLTYRLMMDGVPTYVNLKATSMEDEDDHIIIGVSNVDAQMRAKEEAERIKEERITYSRISALTGNFICIYTVDPQTDRFIEYGATRSFDNLGFSREGDDFFAVVRRESVRALYLDDLDAFLDAFTKDNVMAEIERNGLFAMDYRIMIDGSPTFVSLRAALVEEKDGAQIIVGVSDIDARVKRDMEYAYNLTEARNKANLDALTGVKNKHAYVDIEARLNSQIDEEAPLEFAIVVCDVNELKRINDTGGHRAGDRYLQEACAMICALFKRSPVFRVGGDEFAVIVQGGDYAQLDELMREFHETNAANAGNGGIVVACGMAKYSRDRNVAAVFERADINMYEEKRRLKGIRR